MPKRKRRGAGNPVRNYTKQKGLSLTDLPPAKCCTKRSNSIDHVCGEEEKADSERRNSNNMSKRRSSTRSLSEQGSKRHKPPFESLLSAVEHGDLADVKHFLNLDATDVKSTG
eukprot:661074_1